MNSEMAGLSSPLRLSNLLLRKKKRATAESCEPTLKASEGMLLLNGSQVTKKEKDALKA